jgi:hypothetical protein
LAPTVLGATVSYIGVNFCKKNSPQIEPVFAFCLLAIVDVPLGKFSKTTNLKITKFLRLMQYWLSIMVGILGRILVHFKFYLF